MSERDRILGIQREIDRISSLQRDYERSQAINREIQRYAMQEAIQEPIRSIHESINRYREMERIELQARLGTTQEYLRKIESGFQHSGAAAIEAVEQIRSTLLRGAMEPLAKSFTTNDSMFRLNPSVYESFGRLNEAAARAIYIGEVEISDEEVEKEDEVSRGISDDEAVDADIEAKLVEVVPADTFAQLKRVDFVPLTMLDRILRSPEAMKTLEARDFERFIATLVDQIGFEDVVLTPRSGDEGRDILATKTLHGIKVFFAFECKRYKNPVGPDILRALLGTIRHPGTTADKGVLVTTSTFTPGARTFLLTEQSIDGKDFNGIISWLGEYSKRTRNGLIIGSPH